MNRLRHKIPKDYRAMVHLAEESGWSFTYTGKHPKLTSPDESYAIPIPISSGSPTLVKAVRKRLRAHGLDIP
jgi:hypothetical protein